MIMKISFPHSTEWGVISEDGDYNLPVESDLGHRFRLVDGVVEDRYDGVTDEEVRTIDAQAAAEKESVDLEEARQALISRIKTKAAERIAATDWKVERARERDALNGTTTLQDVYAERELIRQASDEAEVAVAGLASMEAVIAFSW
ncbi:MAG: hypothetical protein HQL67_11055 [Magnetococcales bacterium]|nr:hypothetical protein [Magnetococcales bacterium]